MTWTRLHMRVTTPVFCGDGSVDDAQIRPPSIRGAMRFWLRAMAGVIVGNDLRSLGKIEDAVLGRTEASSPVRLRVPAQPGASVETRPAFLRPGHGADPKWIAYLLGPGLTSWSSQHKAAVLNRAHVPAGREFDLLLRFSTGDQHRHARDCALAALWLAVAFGGIGSRPRRGFGGLAITGAENLPDGWDEARIRTPDANSYTSHIVDGLLWPRILADKAFPALVGLAKDLKVPTPRSEEGHARYPMLSHPRQARRDTAAGGAPRTFSSWEAALSHGGALLRSFRATEEVDEARYSPKLKTWEWFEVVNGPERDFQLGALGLPIVFKQDIEVHAETRENGTAEKLRRASPLWLRPVGDGDELRLLSFGFLSEFLPGPEAAEVHLWKDGRRSKELHTTTEDLHNMVHGYIERLSGEDLPN
ncbi:type III-B CRISPR module RAMP protein Cmr1 [Nocardiopsis composta]|uniref:CRISPR-associated protein Cmr1 n=1 Tax=Nocardiopsis composta TaxID=157465 RepID=A0A7W8QIU3_9ACTN|nr:type III-B CRISPR module RAMP protein Cmr1 [Nocardiopsis composta]MBB5431282.1 CRISPR-associated protein Cmr1 [Nocardiopsis composta]